MGLAFILVRDTCPGYEEWNAESKQKYEYTSYSTWMLFSGDLMLLFQLKMLKVSRMNLKLVKLKY